LIARRSEADMTLLELFASNLRVRDDPRRLFGHRPARKGKPLERSYHEVAHALVLEVAYRRDDKVRRCVGVGEILAQSVLRQPVNGVLGAQNGPSQRMAAPEAFCKQLVDEIVGRV